MSENGYEYNKYTYINSEGDPVTLRLSYTGDVLYGVSADIDHLMSTGEKQYNLIFDWVYSPKYWYNNLVKLTQLRSSSMWFAAQIYHMLLPLRRAAYQGVKRG